MATPALHRVQLRTGPRCDGASTSLGFFRALSEDTNALFSLDADETFEFAVPLSDPLAALLRRRQVVRPIYADGSYHEWLVEEVVTETGAGDHVMRVACSNLLMLLADATLMEQLETTGDATLAGSYTGTVTQFWDNILLGMLTAAGISYVGRGTVDPTEVRTFTWGFGDTPLSMARQAASLTKTELRLRRNGTAGYLVDWLAATNAAMSTVSIRAKKNLHALRRTESARDQATILYAEGDPDAGGTPYSLQRVQWRVSAVNGGTNRVQLASPLGGAGPITEDNQFSTAAVRQYYLLRRRTGRLYPIVDTFAATQELELPDVSTIAVGEWVEFREDNTTAVLEHAYADGKSFLRATAIATNDATLQNPVTNGDPVAADDQYVDWLARISYEVLATTTDNSGQTLFSDGRIKCVSVTGVQVGDWGALLQSATTPWLLSTHWGIFTVTAVDSGANTITVTARYPRQHAWAPGNVSNLLQQLRVFRPRGLTPLVRDSVASTNVATLSSGSGISANDLVEMVQVTGGKQLRRLLSPAAVAQYGRKVGTVQRELQGDGPLNDNAVMSTWTGASNVPPDGYELMGGTITRVSPITYGTYAATVNGSGVRGPIAWMTPGLGQARLSLLTIFRIESGAWWNAVQSRIQLRLQYGNNTATPAGTVSIYGPSNTSIPADGKVVQTLDVVTLTLENLDLEVSQVLSYGVRMQLEGFTDTGAGLTPNFTVDGMWIFPTARVPARLSEFGEGTLLWQAVATQLAAVAMPETYDLDVIDLAAIDGSAYPFADLELGRSVRLIDPDSNAARTGLRIQQRRRYYFSPEQDSIVVSTRPRTFTEMISGATVDVQGRLRYGRRVDR
jgi:hypothetical protein